MQLNICKKLKVVGIVESLATALAIHITLLRVQNLLCDAIMIILIIMCIKGNVAATSSAAKQLSKKFHPDITVA